MKRTRCEKHHPVRWMPTAVFVLIVGAVHARAGQHEPAPVRVQSVEAITLTVSDAERSAAFFSQVLDFHRSAESEQAGEEVERRLGVFGARVHTVALELGDEQIELIEFLAPRGRPMPDDSRANDGWFQHVAIITSDMDAAYARLRSHGVEHASTAPQTLPAWNEKAAGIRAFYFRDPDGHFLEVLQFPPDKGAAKWHRADSAETPLFLGIDHTALVVRDTATALHLYADVLGMTVAGTSENYGTEQEHLNNVFGAHLRITTLRAARGPGIELLEYLTPRDGRPMPTDTRANDLWHWHVNVRVTAGGDTRPVMVRDADGHALLQTPGQ